LIFGLSPNLGLSETLSERLIQTVKWSNVCICVSLKWKNLWGWAFSGNMWRLWLCLWLYSILTHGLSFLGFYCFFLQYLLFYYLKTLWIWICEALKYIWPSMVNTSVSVKVNSHASITPIFASVWVILSIILNTFVFFKSNPLYARDRPAAALCSRVIYSSVRPSVCYQTCEQDIFKRLNQFWCILAQEVTPRGKGTKRSSLGVRMSKVKVTRPKIDLESWRRLHLHFCNPCSVLGLYTHCVPKK